MQKKYPCKGCVEKYTNQYNEVDTENHICPMCIEIVKRKGEYLFVNLPGETLIGIDISEPGADLSTIQVFERGRLIKQDRVD